MLLDILIWGFAVGIIHFIVVGGLYQNPIVAKLYREAEGAPGLKKWENQKLYLLWMFLGTQVEVFILTGAYLFFRQYFADPNGGMTTLIIAGFFSGIRVYPRFWNMWIQSSYPSNLLVVEFVNGIIGTFVIIFGLKLLPV